MARRVFFSFHYQDDIWRANQVRNSWLAHGGQAESFYDDSLWEEARTKGDRAIKRLINSKLPRASVTAVLIGEETASRKYVRYEIRRSLELGKGILGVYIHRLKNKDGGTCWEGTNPFDSFYEDGTDRSTFFLFRLFDDGFGQEALAASVDTYDWKVDDGFKNFAKWVERAARNAGK